tara:strand:+ start:1418 stop:2089 length:672 start_codon:yes stop_codon:yes gene_type:complete
MNYIQLDDVVAPTSYARLHALVTGVEFPWFFHAKDVTYQTNGEFTFGGQDLFEPPKEYRLPGFFHAVIKTDQGPVSPYFALIETAVLNSIQDRLGVECQFFRAIWRLTLNAGDRDGHTTAHVDHDDDHYTAIYYLNDCSGDTVLFDQYDDPKDFGGNVSERWLKGRKQPYTINRRQTPKANSAIIFDGHQYHAGTPPQGDDAWRIVLNINFKTHEHIFPATST